MVRSTHRRKHNSGLNVVQNITLLISKLDRLSRSRSFRQLVAAIAPFIPMLLHVVAKHYGLQ